VSTDLSKRPYSDNNLINGKMNFDCGTVAAGDTTKCNSNAGLAKFRFTWGKVHRLRLINAGAEGMQRFSIDGHMMTVIANDFVPITPYTTNVVTLGAGQRTDVLVTANAIGSSYMMRSNISTICSNTNQPAALAAIYYDNADTTKTPSSKAWNVPDPGTCANDDLSMTVPYMSITPAYVPSTTKTITIRATVNATGHLVWTMNDSTFRADYNNPLLWLASQGNTTYKPEWNVEDFGTNKTIRVVLENPSAAPHPM
jgi:FtsP/CotA-like multicopper oxidase with cupredoxin domain